VFVYPYFIFRSILQYSFKFYIECLHYTLSGEFHFSLYFPSKAPTLHEARIELYKLHFKRIFVWCIFNVIQGKICASVV
jgi:hypothetical protein